MELQGANPPLWRRLKLASDLFLNDVHDVLQVAVGWTDSHLHRFSSRPEFFVRDAEPYLCPFDVAGGGSGIPEDQVRLDEVLADVGDQLFYLYDYGDHWDHAITLEAVHVHEPDAPRAVCTGGEYPCPSEDCGGVTGYEVWYKANESAEPERSRAAAAKASASRRARINLEPLRALAQGSEPRTWPDDQAPGLRGA